MKKITISVFALIISMQVVVAQNCSQFVSSVNGKKFTYVNQNAKDESMGSMICTASKKDASTVNAKIELFDKSGKSMGSGDSEILCTGQAIKVDMKTFIPAASLRQLGNMKLTGDTKYLVYPINLKAGQQLESGALNITVGNSDTQMGQVQLNINNRKVEKQEKVTTKAGTFDCYKITNDILFTLKMMGTSIPFQIKVTEWFTPKLGRFVKSETYSKDGKLIATTMLTAIN